MLDQADLNLLNAVYRNATRGRAALLKLLASVKNRRLKATLDAMTVRLKASSDAAELRLKNNHTPAQGRSTFKRLWAAFKLKLKQARNPSVSGTAEILLQLTAEGISDLTRALRTYPTALPETVSIARRLLENEEAFFQKMKDYL